MLEGEIEQQYDYWADKAFTAELDKRTLDLKTGRVKGISWEEAKQDIKQRKVKEK
jgi:hypothetical protein